MIAYVRRVLPLIAAFSAIAVSARSGNAQGSTVFTWFDPGIHGWPFPNAGFPACPETCKDPVEEAAFKKNWAMCGGMVLTALRHFINEKPPQAPSDPKAVSEDLIQELWDAQKETVKYDQVVTRFAVWETRPDKPHPPLILHTIGYSTNKEWPILTSHLDYGSPVILGLVREGPHKVATALGNNHQVLAIGYREDTDLRQAFVYDPNHPYSIVTLELTAPLEWAAT